MQSYVVGWVIVGGRVQTLGSTKALGCDHTLFIESWVFESGKRHEGRHPSWRPALVEVCPPQRLFFEPV